MTEEYVEEGAHFTADRKKDRRGREKGVRDKTRLHRHLLSDPTTSC
jgi:hypothetical protein